MPLNQVNVDVDWLSDNIDRDDVVVVDGSWHLPPAKRDPKQEFENGHTLRARGFSTLINIQTNPPPSPT